MIKKVISILSVLMALFFISCASSQPEVDDSKTEKPTVEAPVVETPDNSQVDDKNTNATDEEKTGDNASENTELTEDSDELEESEDTGNTETAEDTQTTPDTQTEDGQEKEASENNSEDSDNSENSADSLETDDSEDNTNTSTATDTEVSINSSEQDTEPAESEDEENVDETADDNNEASDYEAADEFADLEIPEDFEEPLVRDLYLPETEDDSENTEESENSEDEENPDENLEQMGEEENSELAENSEEVDEIIEEPEPEEIIIPSRSVTLRKGENLAIIYPGSGWIYMGSLAEYNNMASKGRKLGSQDTKYTLLAKEAGTQIHHFYKVDNLTGQYIDDYIEITVLDKKGSSKTTITAPAYVEVVPQKAETPAKESKPASEPKTEEEQTEETSQTAQVNQTSQTTQTTQTSQTSQTTQTTHANQAEQTAKQEEKTVPEEEDIPLLLDETNSEDEVINVEEDEIFASQEEQPQINTDEILEKAKSAFEDKQYEESFNLLTEFFEYAIDRQDEALYLQGQLLESDSSIKDIKGAVQAYELLVKNYPSSIYWNDANKRIKYLRRFYYLSN